MNQQKFSDSPPYTQIFRPWLGTATHIMAALIPLTWDSALHNKAPSIGLFIWVVIFGLLPDIDTGASIIGRLFPSVSQEIEREFGHRTVTHSLLALGVAASIAYLLFSNAWLILTLAYASHLVVDMLVGQTGILLLYPARLSFDILSIQPNTNSEVIILIAIALIAILPATVPTTARDIANVVVVTPRPKITPTPTDWKGLHVQIIVHTQTPSATPTPLFNNYLQMFYDTPTPARANP